MNVADIVKTVPACRFTVHDCAALLDAAKAQGIDSMEMTFDGLGTDADFTKVRLQLGTQYPEQLGFVVDQLRINTDTNPEDLDMALRYATSPVACVAPFGVYQIFYEFARDNPHIDLGMSVDTYVCRWSNVVFERIGKKPVAVYAYGYNNPKAYLAFLLQLKVELEEWKARKQ